jgi:outer membrane protein
MAAVLAVVACLPPNSAAQDSATRIGYVDMKRLLDNAPQVIAARSRLAEEFAARNDMLMQDERRLADQRQRLARERGTLDTEELLRREDELESLERAIERTRVQLREELQRRTEQETERAWQEINEAVILHARDAGFDLVLPSPVIYASARIDLTEAVLARLRADHSLAQERRP